MIKDRSFLYLSVFIVIFLFFLALLYPQIFPDGRDIHIEERLLQPSITYPFGTDALGRDLLYEVSMGLRTSFFIGIFSLLGALCVGIIMGGIAGMSGKLLDTLIMRMVEVFQSFPGFLLALTFTAFSGASTINIIIALSVMGWASFARFIRGEIIHIKEREFVESARALGASRFHILFNHIIPSFIPHLFVQGSFTLSGFILAESSLSFLGLGGEMVSIGGKIAEGIEFILTYPHICVFPGLVFSLLVLSINLIGESLSDWVRVSEL